MKLGYVGTSAVDLGPYRSTIGFKPNLCREPVWFEGALRDPVRFREVMSALHEIVVGDLRPPKKDRSRHDAYLQRKQADEEKLRAQLTESAQSEILAATVAKPLPPDFQKKYQEAHQIYWHLRRKWASELWQHDRELFRHLVPCDPVVTVAPDVVLFEGFSKDESSYGCVSLDRGAIDGQSVSLGTTNVDYSVALFEHFQSLRSYKETRLHVDPQGFEVNTEGNADYREEKIELPPSWLAGFGQISAAAALDATVVPLSVEALYSLLATLRRRRARTSPRAIRFELEPGKSPRLVLEPWGTAIESRGPAWGGRNEHIRIWGRRRLLVLARALPFVDRCEVHLLGTGLPSFWVLHLGPMRLTLALSGWTTNDWTSGAALDALAGEVDPDETTMEQVSQVLFRERATSFAGIASDVPAGDAKIAAALHRLAKRGQCVFDVGAGVYRWRQILPEAIGEAQLGPEPVEKTEGRKLFAGHKVRITRDERVGDKRLLQGTVQGTKCETLLDLDGRMRQAVCICAHHKKFGIKQGPCRHLLALRLEAPADAMKGAP